MNTIIKTAITPKVEQPPTIEALALSLVDLTEYSVTCAENLQELDVLQKKLDDALNAATQVSDILECIDSSDELMLYEAKAYTKTLAMALAPFGEEIEEITIAPGTEAISASKLMDLLKWIWNFVRSVLKEIVRSIRKAIMGTGTFAKKSASNASKLKSAIKRLDVDGFPCITDNPRLTVRMNINGTPLATFESVPEKLETYIDILNEAYNGSRHAKAIINLMDKITGLYQDKAGRTSAHVSLEGEIEDALVELSVILQKRFSTQVEVQRGDAAGGSVVKGAKLFRSPLGLGNGCFTLSVYDGKEFSSNKKDSVWLGELEAYASPYFFTPTYQYPTPLVVNTNKERAMDVLEVVEKLCVNIAKNDVDVKDYDNLDSALESFIKRIEDSKDSVEEKTLTDVDVGLIEDNYKDAAKVITLIVQQYQRPLIEAQAYGINVAKDLITLCYFGYLKATGKS